MTPSWDNLAWPVQRLGGALRQLAGTRPAGPLPAPGSGLKGAELARWLQATAGHLGFEVEPVDTPHAEVEGLLRSAAPALLQLPPDAAAGPLFVVLLGAGWGGVRVLAPSGAVVALPAAVLRSALCRPLEAEVAPAVERVVARVGG
jgi:hypothetical protein